MEDKKQPKLPLPALLVTARPTKKPRKRKSEAEKAATKQALDKARGQTRVNIGGAFERWRQLRELKGLKSDAEVAVFLLNSYEMDLSTSTPAKHRLMRPPPPPVSSIVAESLSDRDDDFSVAGVEELNISCPEETALQQLDASMSSLDISIDVVDADDFNDIRNSIIDWEDEDVTWNPDMDTQSVSSLEDVTRELDSDDDDSDDADFRPRICVRTGGALKTPICLESLPEINMEDTVHDATDNAPDKTMADMPTLPEAAKVMVVDDIIGHPASIAYHDSLKQLAEYLLLPVSMCSAKDPNSKAECRAPAPFEINVRSRGTAAVVEWMCPRGHTVWKWASQPILKYGMLAGDFMLSTNILLSGNNYAKISLLFKFMNMGMVERSTFFRIQDSYCVDTIKEFWDEKRAAVITQLKSKGPVVALGDARMDSPGFCAQYCTYSVMDNGSKQIICMVNIDKRETMRNSVIMEKEGFMRAFDKLCEELNIEEFCTDAHSQISALFNNKGKYKDCGVRHTLDMWHGSKSLGKRIHAAGQQRGCTILQMWSKDICNHFWYCCKTADTYEDFFDMWAGLLHHVTGEHAWALGACQHGPLVEDREKEWIQKGSVAHQRLTEVVLDARWLKSIHKYLHFRSTADLESFHNHILMYASKRFCFSPPVYAARVMLAGLDHNHHVDRPAKRRADGSIQYGKVYNKKSRKWSLYTLKVEKDYSYIVDLQSVILQRRMSATGGLPRTRKKRPDDPRQHGVLSGVPAPSTQELLQKQLSRGLGKSLPKE
ncbi:uncharacterized protein [Paramisgurnus dabryanus]|uniref:uncharacterized protein n=1 Tax=Paramisgurnus dabryanus TaxID=90735 RepID=UPI0031F396DD